MVRKSKSSDELGYVIDEHTVFEAGSSVGSEVMTLYSLFRRTLRGRLAPAGLSYSAFRILRALWMEDGLSQAELSRRTGISQPATVQCLNRLEQDSLATRVRDKSDRRITKVWLAERAQELRAMYLQTATQVNKDSLEGFTEEEYALLMSMLSRLIRNLEKHRIT